LRLNIFNNSLFNWAKRRICTRLGLPAHIAGWAGYLSRRFRRSIAAGDINEAMVKQLTTPLEIPFELEDYISHLIRDALDDHGIRNGRRPGDRILIPARENGLPVGNIPDLPETTGPEGNLRIWVIDNDLLWTGVDRRIDE
jgi:hypothetical protein